MVWYLLVFRDESCYDAYVFNRCIAHSNLSCVKLSNSNFLNWAIKFHFGRMIWCMTWSLSNKYRPTIVEPLVKLFYRVTVCLRSLWYLHVHNNSKDFTKTNLWISLRNMRFFLERFLFHCRISTSRFHIRINGICFVETCKRCCSIINKMLHVRSFRSQCCICERVVKCFLLVVHL